MKWFKAFISSRSSIAIYTYIKFVLLLIQIVSDLLTVLLLRKIF